MKNIIIIAIILVVSLGSLFGTLIPDNNFKMVINEELGQAADHEPNVAELGTITDIYSFNIDIISMEGAQYLTNLETISFYYNQVSDLSPISGLTNLKQIHLIKSQISDLNPISGLTNLETLTFGSNQVSDLSPISGLISLKKIRFANNLVSDLNPISGLTNLESLSFSNNQVSDLSPISGLISLEYLIFSNNQVSDLSPISGLTNLESLAFYNNTGLYYNQVNDLNPISGLTNLESLSFSNNQVSDLSPVFGLTNLESLSFSNNQVSDLSPISGLTNLESLAFYNNQVSDLSPISGLTNFRYLNLWGNLVRNIVPLENFGLTNDAYYLDVSNQKSGPLTGQENLQVIEVLETREIDSFYFNFEDQTLPVELSSFSAVQTAENFAKINWTTQSETSLMGFNILRNNSENINSSLQMSSISASNSSCGEFYSFTDEDVETDNQYFYWLESVEIDGSSELFGPISIEIKAEEDEEGVPGTIENQLNPAYPNPFNPSTTISFSVKEGEVARFEIFNIKGQLVKSFPAFHGGNHEVKWSGKNDSGASVSSGTYFYKLQTESFAEVRKMLLLK